MDIDVGDYVDIWLFLYIGGGPCTWSYRAPLKGFGADIKLVKILGTTWLFL